MPALDTNVLVRRLTREGEAQALKAKALLDAHAGKDDALFVSDVVLAELTWTLDRAKGLGRPLIASALKALADNATLSFEAREVLRHAQELFAVSTALSKAGFADSLIVAKAAARSFEPVFTFERGMRGLPGCTPL